MSCGRGRRRAALFAAAWPMLLPSLVAPQQLSEKASVAQTIDGTTITIEYFRPVARGRTPFPEVVHWGRVWTPGANWATTFDVDKPIHVDGNPVPKGKYAVWMIPDSVSWTVILSREARRFHTQPPKAEDEQLRFPVKPVTGAHMETLTFYFPVITRDGATLDMHWGTTVVPMRILVEPSKPASLSDRQRATYVGTYHVTPVVSDANVPDMTLAVTDSGGRLHARATPALWGYDTALDLIPSGRDSDFRIGFYRDGKPFGMEAEGHLTFQESGGRATGFELLAFTRVLARGTREN